MNNNTKEPFGLTTVFHPAKAEEILAHVVFVHGLGGGSEHTCTKDGVFWPRDLLPMQYPFQNVATILLASTPLSRTVALST